MCHSLSNSVCGSLCLFVCICVHLCVWVCFCVFRRVLNRHRGAYLRDMAVKTPLYINCTEVTHVYCNGSYQLVYQNATPLFVRTNQVTDLALFFCGVNCSTVQSIGTVLCTVLQSRAIEPYYNFATTEQYYMKVLLQYCYREQYKRTVILLTPFWIRSFFFRLGR